MSPSHEEGPALSARIDWLQFYIATPSPFGGIGLEAQRAVVSLVRHLVFGEAFTHSLEDDWTVGSGRQSYAAHIEMPDYPGSFFFGTINAHVLCVFSGRDCDVLRERDQLMSGERVSRVDLAVDIECDTTPSQFCLAGYTSKSRTQGLFSSSDGETVYIGSRTSDHMVRVYRYYPPHPRAHLLRLEIEAKGDLAKAFAAQSIGLDERSLVLAAHARMNWLHTDYKPGDEAAPLMGASRSDKAGRHEIAWLLKSVLPALLRYQQEEIFDVLTWLEDEVLPALRDHSMKGGSHEDTA
jgi:hypothetical protein